MWTDVLLDSPRVQSQEAQGGRQGASATELVGQQMRVCVGLAVGKVQGEGSPGKCRGEEKTRAGGTRSLGWISGYCHPSQGPEGTQGNELAEVDP